MKKTIQCAQEGCLNSISFDDEVTTEAEATARSGWTATEAGFVGCKTPGAGCHMVRLVPAEPQSPPVRLPKAPRGRRESA